MSWNLGSKADLCCKEELFTLPRLTCPHFSSGGWWQSECEETNLNGNYVTPRSRGRLDRGKGLYWKPKKGRYYLLKSTKIMIHPTDLKSLD